MGRFILLLGLGLTHSNLTPTWERTIGNYVPFHLAKHAVIGFNAEWVVYKEDLENAHDQLSNVIPSGPSACKSRKGEASVKPMSLTGG